MNTFPVIKLEIEGMRHTVVVALTEYAARMDSDIKAAVDAAVTPENISRIITDTVGREIKLAIETEIHRFFTYDREGAAFIRRAVDATLAEDVRRLERDQ